MAQSVIGSEDFGALSLLSDDILVNEDTSSGLSDSQRSIRLTLDETMFEKGTSEYRKARKQRQNRESAARSRVNKQKSIRKLKLTVQFLNTTIAELKRDNRTLRMENAAMRREIKGLNEVKSEETKAESTDEKAS